MRETAENLAVRGHRESVLLKIIHSGFSVYPNYDTGRRVPPQGDSVLLVEEPRYDKRPSTNVYSATIRSSVSAVKHVVVSRAHSGRE